MNKKHFYSAIGILAVILLFLGWTQLAQNKNDDTHKINIPDTLASLPRTAVLSGPEAMQQITQMHGKNISLSEGYVAKYEDSGRQIMLWISVSPSRTEGEQLFKMMDEKMPSSKVFTDRKNVTLDGRAVVRVLGMGMEHYYWVDGRYNYWVAVGGIDATPVIKEVQTKLE